MTSACGEATQPVAFALLYMGSSGPVVDHREHQLGCDAGLQLLAQHSVSVLTRSYPAAPVLCAEGPLATKSVGQRNLILLHY